MNEFNIIVHVELYIGFNTVNFAMRILRQFVFFKILSRGKQEKTNP